MRYLIFSASCPTAPFREGFECCEGFLALLRQQTFMIMCESFDDGALEVIDARVFAPRRSLASAPRRHVRVAADKAYAELIGGEISAGHAFDKHVIERGEFPA